MNEIELFGLSNKGRNLIRRFGSKWVILERRAVVACCNNKEGWLIQPVDAPLVPSRWFNPNGDPDFNRKS